MLFTAGILLGIYAYGIFFLGIFHLLYPAYIIAYLILFLLVSYFIYKPKVNIQSGGNFLKDVKKDKIILILLLYLLLQFIINGIGALAPDIAFDAMWYHVTLPKLYLLSHTIMHLPGGVIPYSDMPKIGEMFYTTALAIGDERVANVIQLFAGVFCSYIIYRMTKKYMSQRYALIAVVIFYSNIAVAWESTVAYIDLIRTIFELLALWSFFIYISGKTKDKKYYFLSAVFTGFAITTKLLALGSLGIFAVLLWFYQKNQTKLYRLKSIGLYTLIALLIPVPWFIFSLIHTGNPIYPFFTPFYPTNSTIALLNPIIFIQTIMQLFTQSSDPISPMYLIVLPLIIWKYKSFSKEIKLLSVYCLLAVFVWYITPQTGGGRFIIPYLPAFSIITAYVISYLCNKKKDWDYLYSKLLIILVLLFSLTTLLYRTAASIRYFPVVFGGETKNQFLTKNLNFSYGDFYDTDRYFKNHIKPTDKVLLYGFHNLYYIDFPFIDFAWAVRGERFNYIATQSVDLPSRFYQWKKIYYNPITHVTVYNDNGKIWKY